MIPKKGKKEELIGSLQKLHITSLEKVIKELKKMDFSKEDDLNATLTQLIYLSVLVPHARIMDPKFHGNKALRSFCLHKISEIKPQTKPTKTRRK